MSSVSSVGGDNYLAQWLQRVAAQKAAQKSTTATSSAPRPTQDSDGDGDGSGSSVQPPLIGSGLFGKIAAAVINTLNSAQSASSTGSNAAIQNAMAQIINGGTTTAVPSTGAGIQSAASNVPGGDGDQADATSSPSSFFQTLQGYGVDPAQFRQDFLAGIQSATTGKGHASVLSQTFPPGSLIDQTA